MIFCVFIYCAFHAFLLAAVGSALNREVLNAVNYQEAGRKQQQHRQQVQRASNISERPTAGPLGVQHELATRISKSSSRAEVQHRERGSSRAEVQHRERGRSRAEELDVQACAGARGERGPPDRGGGDHDGVGPGRQAGHWRWKK